MPIQVFDPTDAIPVGSLVLVLYGAPGTWKSSLSATVDGGFLMDFDKGAHRTAHRCKAARFDTFSDVYGADARRLVDGCKTVYVDTVGRALDTLAHEITSTNPKMQAKGGGLSLQGFGLLKGQFANWMRDLRMANKDVVLVCHEKEERGDGDSKAFRPDIQGGSYAEVHKQADLIGYLSVDSNGRRWLDFNPTDSYLGKNSAGFEKGQVPPVASSPHFLGELIAEARRRIGRTAEASAAVAREVQGWADWLGTDPNVETFNAKLPELAHLTKPAKLQVWALVKQHGEAAGLVYDPQAKAFHRAAEGSAVA